MAWLWGGKGERHSQVWGDTQGSPGFFRRGIPLLLWCCQLQPPQPSLGNVPLPCSSVPIPASPWQSTEVSQVACGVSAATAPVGADRPGPTPSGMLEETAACLIPHNDQLQARRRLSSRECDLGYEQHNPVTPTHHQSPSRSLDGSQYQSHLVLVLPVSLAGAGKAPAQLRQPSGQAQAQTGQDKDSTCCMPGPLPFLKDLHPAEMKCSSSVQGEELRAEAHTGHVHTHAEMAQRRKNTLRHDREG